MLAALAVAPFGWWVMAFPGIAIYVARLDGRSWRRRIVNGVAFGLGLYGLGLAWAWEFAGPAIFVFVAVESVVPGVFAALVPARPAVARALAFPGMIAVSEVVRSVWPFGGLPLSGLDLGQAGGPLAALAGLGGRYLIVAAVAAGGVALAEAWRRRLTSAAVAATAVVVLAVVAWVVPPPARVGSIRIAVLQGGGERGIRAEDADKQAVFESHVDATRRVRPPVDLVLWPEDVVDVEKLAGSDQERQLRALARELRTTLVAGVVEDASPGRFLNFSQVYEPDGSVGDRYEKVHRVPFGEYFPFRSLLEALASIPKDEATAGPYQPGRLETPAGDFGVVISYEVFFQGRARSAVGEGEALLLVPTNASSYTTGQMPDQEIAAARLRAWQTGRTVLQAGPTGFSAVIDHRGRVDAKTDLGRRQVVQLTVDRRRGSTPYQRTGDWPVVAVAVALLAAAWAFNRCRRSGPPSFGPPRTTAPASVDDKEAVATVATSRSLPPGAPGSWC